MNPKLSPKDKKIISENPNASLDVLLAKGLSQKGYDLMIADEEKAATKVEASPTPLPSTEGFTVQPTPMHRAEPQLRPAVPYQTNSDDTVWLISPDGKRTSMTRSSAMRQVRKDARFKIA